MLSVWRILYAKLITAGTKKIQLELSPYLEILNVILNMQFMLLYSKVKEISNIYLNLLGD
jgi:hypothetical protein